MSKAIIRLALAVWITSALSGCGTVMNVSDRDDVSLMRDGPTKVYGGVSWDAASGCEYLVEVVKPKESLLDRLQSLACGTYLLAIDLPLSVLGDTLTLPFTIPAANTDGAP